MDTLRETVQRLTCQVERLTAERDSLISDRDAANEKIDNLQRDMAAGDKAKAAALEVSEFIL